MGFYEKIAPYYHMIFPPNPTTIEFLLSYVRANDRVLDIGCGSGTYTHALAKQSMATFVGYDIDGQMIKEASKQQGSNERYCLQNILTMEDTDTFQFVYCIGNTLVHLNDVEQIKQVVENMYQALQENGMVSIQIINYDRILDDKVDHLPTIEKEHVTFERLYKEVNEKIEFTSILHTDGQVEEQSVLLVPLRKHELQCILEEVGFKDIHFYKNFKKEAWDKQGFHTIVTAKK